LRKLTAGVTAMVRCASYEAGGDASLLGSMLALRFPRIVDTMDPDLSNPALPPQWKGVERTAQSRPSRP
jgi:hypothetical protein